MFFLGVSQSNYAVYHMQICVEKNVIYISFIQVATEKSLLKKCIISKYLSNYHHRHTYTHKHKTKKVGLKPLLCVILFSANTAIIYIAYYININLHSNVFNLSIFWLVLSAIFYS